MELEQVKELLHNSHWVYEWSPAIGTVKRLDYWFNEDYFLKINSDSYGPCEIIQEEGAFLITFHPYSPSDRLKIVEI